MRALLPVLLAAALLSACGGGDDAAAPTAPAPPATTEPASTSTGPAPATVETDDAPDPLPGLPAWTAGYETWTRLNDRPIPPRESDPHLSTKNVYVTARADGGVYPPGTIVVKEGVRPGADFVGLVATMRKIAGANPEHADWVFVEWARDAAGRPFTKLAEGAVCESCHGGVAGRDYVFTRG
jgi:hypothetical protein